MTIPLLENPLIHKYFGCNLKTGCICPDGNCTQEMSYRILRAMGEPYFEGDKFLHIEKDGITEKVADCNGNHFHGFMLRLPEKFQMCCDYKKGVNLKLPGAAIQICSKCMDELKSKLPLLGPRHQENDIVEQRIKEIARMEVSPTPTIEFMEGVLRELVSLARAR